MEIIRSLKRFKPLPSSVLTIGSYDGIHRGSQLLIEFHGDHDEYHRMIQWLKQMRVKV
jgi:FAD synthase